LYLGAVFAVEKEWFDKGKRLSSETRHDFRAWARRLDWIVQNILGAPPLLDGHRETQLRMSNPNRNWQRDLALAVRRAGQLDAWLRANILIDIMANDGSMEVPGQGDGDDLEDEDVRRKVLQATGRRLSMCFGDENVRIVDGIAIHRQQSVDSFGRKVNEYRFQNADPGPSSPSSPLSARYEPAMRSPTEMPISPIPANDSEDFFSTEAVNTTSTDIHHDHISILPTDSGYSGTPENYSGTLRGRIGEPIAEDVPASGCGDDEPEEATQWEG
jgi:hypothetical protein